MYGLNFKPSLGILVVFETVTNEHPFWKTNPNAAAHKILNITKRKNLLSRRINKVACMSFCVASLQAAHRLLAVTSLCAIEVTTSVPHIYSRNLGKIKGVPVESCDRELLECLKDFGLISVKRQVPY